MELVWVPHHLLRLSVTVPGGPSRRHGRSDPGMGEVLTGAIGALRQALGS
jgi:hypothetical protein